MIFAQIRVARIRLPTTDDAVSNSRSELDSPPVDCQTPAVANVSINGTPQKCGKEQTSYWSWLLITSLEAVIN